MIPIAFHPIYKHPLPEGHRFPMLKYELLPQQLVHEGTAVSSDFFEPDIPDLKHILSVHTKEYVADLMQLSLNPKAARKIGFPLSKELVERELRIANGTIIGCQKALEKGIAFNSAGGTHHAYSDRGEAFCLLNDQAIGAQYLLNQKLAKKILMVDLDVHQGNGTAEIFQKNDAVFTFSMHGKSNYPFKKEQSDLDIALPDGTDDYHFLELLSKNLPHLITTHQPDFIFYLAGVDILETDKLGKLSCTMNGCKKRDEFVFDLCKKNGIPVQVSMGGGYSPELNTIVEAHANTFRTARQLYY
jgi:acetoin utilization deacetylase AcuC-like enzyme